MALSENILHYLELNKSNYIRDLRSLVEIETPSDNPIYISKSFAIISKILKSLDFYVDIIPGKKTGGILYSRPLNKKKHCPIQLLIGHIDTVWPIGSISSLPIEIKKDKFKGPGVFDMKSGVLNILYALKAIRESNLKLNVCPVIVINSDEEIGSLESTPLIKRLSKIAVRALILEPSLDGKIKTRRVGVGKYTILIKGKAAHAGLNPDQGASAIVELSHIIQKLFSMNDPSKGISVNVGLINGGVRPNVIAPESKAIIDVRVPTLIDAERIDREIKSIESENKEVELNISGNIGRPPMEKTERNKALWILTMQKAKELNIKIEETMAGGGSDANTTSQYTATIDGLGAVGDGAHAMHEFIYHDKYTERCALLSLLILEDAAQN